jgi:hypothetical protein
MSHPHRFARSGIDLVLAGIERLRKRKAFSNR